MLGLKLVYYDRSSMFCKAGNSVTVKLKRKIRGISGVNEVQMTLEDFGTNALNCDSVARLSVSELGLIPRTSCRQCHHRRRNCLAEVRATSELRDPIRTQRKKTPSASIAIETGGWATAIIKASKFLMTQP